MPTDTPTRGLTTTDRTKSRGRVTIQRFDADALEMAMPFWPDLPKRQRLAVCSLLAPTAEQTTHNVVCRGQHELLAEYLDREQDPGETAAYLAVGTGNGTSPTYGDTALNNEGYRAGVTDSSTDDTTLITTTFLDATEANDMDPSTSTNAVREVGLATHETPGAGRLLNHALVDPEPKSSTVALSIVIELSWVVP